MISPARQKALEQRMQELGIREKDLEESFIKGAGKGGQKINKTSSCVRLTHTPSGIEIRCQQSRSQADNRYFARHELCEKLAEQIAGEKNERRQAAEKIRRQKRRRSRRAKEKMLADKKQQSVKKTLRTPIRE